MTAAVIPAFGWRSQDATHSKDTLEAQGAPAMNAAGLEAMIQHIAPYVMSSAEPLAMGGGESRRIYTAVAGSVVEIAKGTNAAPDTTTGPVMKVSRTLSLTKAAIEAVGGAGTDGGEQTAAIYGVASGTAACEVQPIGVFAGAKTASTTGAPGNDACAVYGVGRSLAGSSGHAFGGFLLGRRDSAAGGATGAEIDVYNGETADTYNSVGNSLTKGIAVNALGGFQAGAGVVIGNALGGQFDVGLAFTAQVLGGFTGGVANASIRDDSTSKVSLDIRGKHATAAITVANGSGAVVIGGQSQLSAGSLLELQAPTEGAIDPALRISSSASVALSQRIINSNGSAILGLAGASNQFATGTVAGDVVLRTGAAVRLLHIGGTESGGGCKPVVSIGDKALGFFTATPAAKPTVTGSRGANAALASLLTGLSTLGLLTDSTTA